MSIREHEHDAGGNHTGRLFLVCLLASCLRGAFPPVDFLAVCYKRQCCMSHRVCFAFSICQEIGSPNETAALGIFRDAEAASRTERTERTQERRKSKSRQGDPREALGSNQAPLHPGHEAPRIPPIPLSLSTTGMMHRTSRYIPLCEPYQNYTKLECTCG